MQVPVCVISVVCVLCVLVHEGACVVAAFAPLLHTSDISLTARIPPFRRLPCRLLGFPLAARYRYDAVLADLDRLEDYVEDSADNLYIRAKRDVVMEDGTMCCAWVYICQIDPAQTASVAIGSPGDWRVYLESSEKAAFMKTTEKLPL